MLEACRFALSIALECLPAAADELAGWRRRAAAIPDPELRRQALGSIEHKAFHSLGASVFAAWAPASARRALVGFTVALQTLSDYLDNLCDRGPTLSVAAMRRLHGAMAAAVRAGCRGRDVLRGLAEKDAYLRALVARCRGCLDELPSYGAVETLNVRFAVLYGQMQARKHGAAGQRRQLLARWFERRACEVPSLSWWEFAAACGSTLPVFALTALAARHPRPAEVEAAAGAYFPWIAALHILLDYLIDRAEDAAVGELNFAACYGPLRRALGRLRWLYRCALHQACRLPDPAFHRLVVAGLAAVYLSDPKARHLRRLARALAAEDGYLAALWPLVAVWRRRSPPAPAQVAPWVQLERTRGCPQRMPNYSSCQPIDDSGGR